MVIPMYSSPALPNGQNIILEIDFYFSGPEDDHSPVTNKPLNLNASKNLICAERQTAEQYMRGFVCNKEKRHIGGGNGWKDTRQVRVSDGFTIGPLDPFQAAMRSDRMDLSRAGCEHRRSAFFSHPGTSDLYIALLQLSPAAGLHALQYPTPDSRVTRCHTWALLVH